MAVTPEGGCNVVFERAQPASPSVADGVDGLEHWTPETPAGKVAEWQAWHAQNINEPNKNKEEIDRLTAFEQLTAAAPPSLDGKDIEVD